LCTKQGANNRPYNHGAPKSNFYIKECNFMYEMWIFCAPVFILCIHLLIQIKKRLLWKKINCQLGHHEVNENTDYRSMWPQIVHHCLQSFNNFAIILAVSSDTSISCARCLSGLQGNVQFEFLYLQHLLFILDILVSCVLTQLFLLCWQNSAELESQETLSWIFSDTPKRTYASHNIKENLMPSCTLIHVQYKGNFAKQQVMCKYCKEI
jgi:hypothetical protein